MWLECFDTHDCRLVSKAAPSMCQYLRRRKEGEEGGERKRRRKKPQVFKHVEQSYNVTVGFKA